MRNIINQKTKGDSFPPTPLFNVNENSSYLPLFKINDLALTLTGD